MNMSSVDMCDNPTRVWCCRIGLVFSVLGVLSTMIFQIWSYYFSLVQQMDDIVIESPTLGAIFRICDNVEYSWNTECSQDGLDWHCTMNNAIGQNFFVDQIGGANVTYTGTFFRVQRITECVRVMVWFIPW